MKNKTYEDGIKQGRKEMLEEILEEIKTVSYKYPEKAETIAWNKACKFIRKSIIELQHKEDN